MSSTVSFFKNTSTPSPCWLLFVSHGILIELYMCHAHAVLFMATTKSSPFSRPDPRHALALENVVYVYFARAVQAKFSVIEAYFVIVGYLKSTSRKMDIWVLAFGPELVESLHNISSFLSRPSRTAFVTWSFLVCLSIALQGRHLDTSMTWRSSSEFNRSSPVSATAYTTKRASTELSDLKCGDDHADFTVFVSHMHDRSWSRNQI